MSRFRALLTVVLISLLLALTAPPTTQLSTSAQSEQVYLALGDSIPSGLLASLPGERSYPAILRDLIAAERLASDSPGGVDLINLAEPGETIETFLEDGQLEAALEEIENTPDDALRTVTLTIGGNNLLALWESTAVERENELQAFASDFVEAIDQLESALDGYNADVVVTTYYDLTEGDADVEGSDAWWLGQFNAVIEEAATESGFQVVDLQELFRDRISVLTWFPADIHPNNAGHELIARAIWRNLGYDENPPVVEIVRPEPGAVQRRVPTIHAVVDDPVGIESVVFEVNGEQQRQLIYVTAYDAWVGLWDARQFDGIEAELTVAVTDVSGNESKDAVTISLPSR